MDGVTRCGSHPLVTPALFQTQLINMPMPINMQLVVWRSTVVVSALVGFDQRS